MRKAKSGTNRGKAVDRKARVKSKPSPVRSKVRTRRASAIDTLRRQLEEAQETLRAVTSGEVDALVVAGPAGDQVFTLKDADRPYRHLAEQMTEGACTLSAEGIILFANSTFTELLGVPMEQAMGTSLAHWVCPDAQPRFARLLQQSLAGAAKGEIELVRTNGHALPVQLSLSRLQADEGLRITAVVFDLRERKQNEQTLRRLNQELEKHVAERTAQLAGANNALKARGEELQAVNEELELANEELLTANDELVETNRRAEDEIARRERIKSELEDAKQKAKDLIRYAPTAIYEIDFRGPRFTSVNDAMCALSGYKREELLAMSPFALLDPDSQIRFQERIRKTFAGEPIDETVEYRAIVKDGRELYVTLQTRLIYEGNKPVGAFVIGHDMTERRRVEEALRQSREQYRDLVESSNSIIMRADEHLNITYMNPFGLDYFGYTAKELIGKNVMGTTIPMQDGAGRDLSTMAEDIARHPEEYKTNVHQNMRKNGELVWVSWTNKVTYDRDGKFLDILAIGNDINQAKKAEEAKRQSEDLLQTVLDGSPDPVYVKDRSSRILLANRALSDVVGKPLAQIVGKTDSEYYENPTVGQALREHDLQVMTAGTSAAFEETVTTPEGERTFLSSKAPYRNAAGEIIGITGISRDITERKRMEDALRQATRQAENHQRVLESVIQQMPAGVIITDATGAVARNNKAMDRIWRREMLPTENVDQHGYVAYHLDGREYRLEEWPLSRSLRGGEEIIGEEMVILRGDGTRGTVYVSSAPIRDDDDNIIGGVVIDVDISELKQAEEQIHRLNRQLEQRAGELELANKELESFSYSISHDLRAPLASVNGFATMLLQEQSAALPDDARRLVDLIQRNNAEMSQLVDGLLRFSRSIRQPLTKQTVDLNSLVRQVVEDLKAAQAGRRIDIVYGGLPPAQADPVLLKQVLTNIIANALKFTRERQVAKIQIGSTTTEKGEIVYHVRDNGVGFDAAHAAGLFGVFQRFHSEEDYEGTGIGLAIVERVIRRHGGRVWAESEVDQGATFYFSLD